MAQEERIYSDKSPITDRTVKYYKRQEDGIHAHLSLMSELALTSEANGYPREVNASIETAFKEVKDEIRAGQWISAKEACELVSVGGYITQELYDRIYTTITNYISVNY